jgi:hypothetical protein
LGYIIQYKYKLLKSILLGKVVGWRGRRKISWLKNLRTTDLFRTVINNVVIASLQIYESNGHLKEKKSILS